MFAPTMIGRNNVAHELVTLLGAERMHGFGLNKPTALVKNWTVPLGTDGFLAALSVTAATQEEVPPTATGSVQAKPKTVESLTGGGCVMVAP